MLNERKSGQRIIQPERTKARMFVTAECVLTSSGNLARILCKSDGGGNDAAQMVNF